MGVGLTFDVRLAGRKRKTFLAEDVDLLSKLGFRFAQVRPLADYCRQVTNRVFSLPDESVAESGTSPQPHAPLKQTPPEEFAHASLTRVSLPVSEERFVRNIDKSATIRPAIAEEESSEAQDGPRSKFNRTTIVGLVIVATAYLRLLYLISNGWL